MGCARRGLMSHFVGGAGKSCSSHEASLTLLDLSCFQGRAACAPRRPQAPGHAALACRGKGVVRGVCD
jgi:hypothetical protein